MGQGSVRPLLGHAEKGRCSVSLSDEHENTCKAVFASDAMMAVTGPCGHPVPIEDSMEGEQGQRFRCPICGMRWRIETGPPKVYRSGFIAPGKRTVVIDQQWELPLR
jgi:hypothetical protein